VSEARIRDRERAVLTLAVLLAGQFQRVAAIVVGIPTLAVAASFAYSRVAWRDRYVLAVRTQGQIWRARRSRVTKCVWLALFALLVGWVVARLGS
jgi:hypothetical protein